MRSARICLTITASALAFVVAAAMPAHAASPVAPRGSVAWPPLASAAPFFLRELRRKTDGDWDDAWQTLYPLHQQVASRSEFVACERLRPFPAPLEGLRVLGVRKSLVHVPGLARPVPGVAVDVRVKLRWYGPRDPIVTRYTFHLVPVHRHWTWLLSPSRYRLYRADGCISGSLRLSREAPARRRVAERAAEAVRPGDGTGADRLQVSGYEGR